MRSAHRFIAFLLFTSSAFPLQAAELLAISTDARAVVLRDASGEQRLVRVGERLAIDDWKLTAVRPDSIRIESVTGSSRGSLEAEIRKGENIRTVLDAIPEEKGFGEVPLPIVLPVDAEPSSIENDAQ